MKQNHVMGPLSAALVKVYGGTDARMIIRLLAQDVVSEASIQGPPFSPFECARALGIRVEYDALGAEGVLSHTPEGVPFIILAKRDYRQSVSSQRRETFTLAHEIGHYVIRRTLLGFMPVSSFKVDDPEEEFLCDAFASELLMPRDVITADLREYGLVPDAVLHLANKYNVSLQSFLCRCTELCRGYFAGALWVKRDAEFRPSWATPRKYRTLRLCDTGHSSVERAYENAQTQSGSDHVLLDGKRMCWNCASTRLPGSRMVLTLMTRQSEKAREILPRILQPNIRTKVTGPKIPIQRQLPFPSSKPLLAARKSKRKECTS
jgi:Zn-dependent peptidase ImmA (M78 family)